MAWEVETQMPIEEFHDWLTYLKWKNEEEVKAAEKARKKSGRR
jgi:hypothetical protein